MKKKYLIWIIVIFLLISCSVKCSYDKKQEKTNTYEVEVYSKHLLSELVGRVKNDYYIDTSDIKKYNIEYIDEEENNNCIEINVTDNTKPYIGIRKSYTYITTKEFNLLDKTLCGDNYDRNIKCRLDGYYNLEKEGKYDLTIIGEDTSGNKEEKNFTLNVVKKLEYNNSISSYLSLNDVKKRNITNIPLLIDVSKWQGDIDFSLVKDSGIDYVMMRLGTQKGIGLDSKIDEYFEENYERAINAGLKVGVYYFSYAKNVEEAQEQAKFVLDILNGRLLTLPVAFDWECWEYFNNMNLNFHDLNTIANTFLREIEKNGYKPLLYGSKNYLENVWNLDYDIWLAHYTEKTNYTGSKIMWQFASNAQIPGIRGNADINFYYGNK